MSASKPVPDDEEEDIEEAVPENMIDTSFKGLSPLILKTSTNQ